MKKIYRTFKIEIFKLLTKDVVCTSGEGDNIPESTDEWPENW